MADQTTPKLDDCLPLITVVAEERRAGFASVHRHMDRVERRMDATERHVATISEHIDSVIDQARAEAQRAKYRGR